MDNAIVFQLSLRPDAAAEKFETAFRGIVEETRESRGAAELDQVEYQLYRPIPAGTEYLWVTRFPDSELDRVTRSAWPFVLLEVRGILMSIRERFAVEVTALSGVPQTLRELEEDWNTRFGRFSKLTLETPDPSIEA